MKDKDFLALGNMTNSSEAMFERRRRILSAARKMIDEVGPDGFSIRELSKRADVAARTLYNAFENKENIIALAIQGYFEAFNRTIRFDTDPASFEGALEHQVATTVRNQQIPNYLRTVASLYFSPSLHPAIRTVLLDVGTRYWRPWLNAVADQNGLVRGVDVEGLLVDLSNLQFAKVHEWGLGELDDRAFFDRTLDAVLLMLAGATKGSAQAEVKAAFRRLRRSSEYRTALFDQALSRLSVITHHQ